MNTSSNPRVARLILLLMLAFVFLIVSCPEDDPGLDCSEEPLKSPMISPYDSPVWHPSGEFIGFNYKPRDSMLQVYPCYYEQYFNMDSSGFWVIDADGNNMRRVLPYMLYRPAWSSDGQWIAFSFGGCIYKMRFTGSGFDTTSILQLTFSGREYTASWSPDGERIAHDNGECGCIRSLPIAGGEGTFIHGGGSPSWSPDGQWIAYEHIPQEIYKVRVSNPLDSVRLTHRNSGTSGDGIKWDSRYPKYSPNGEYIVFYSARLGGLDDLNLWLIETDGDHLRRLTSHGTLDAHYSWSPNSRRIVYLKYEHYDFRKTNGTLWIVDVATDIERQLTFNRN